MPTIFISATSRDLKSYRQIVTDWAKTKGHDVVVQDEFPVQSDYSTIVQMLRDKLSPCDAIIHLAGLFYGFEPTNRPDGEVRRSYTQLEYELGKELKRQVFRFIARPDYQPDLPIEQTEEQASLQDQHRRQLTGGNEPYHQFSVHDDLRTLLDKLVIQKTLAKPNNLPLVGAHFKGRDQFLEQLQTALTNKPTHIAVVTGKQAIHGLGGVGKTRLAVEYACRHADKYTALLFITADSKANFKANLAQLCGPMVLNLPEQEVQEQEAQVAAAVRWLREHAGWFLIVDNVDTPEAAMAVEGLLQRLDSGHVVITSRLSSWGAPVHALALDVLSESAAVEFLLERTAGKRKVTPSDEAVALALAQDLRQLPLALEQAGAFISELGYSFAEYRADWRKHDENVLTWFDERAMKYPRSVAATWETSFRRLNDHGRGLLNVLCWLAPDPIPVAMLEKLTDEEGEPAIKIRFGIGDLAKYSFLKWKDDAHTSVVMHRLVQEIAEYRLPQDHKHDCLRRSLRMVNEFCDVDPSDVLSWPEVYTPAQRHIAAISRAADQAGIIEPTSRLMGVLATYLFRRFELGEAETLLRRLLDKDEETFGYDHAKVAQRLSNLAQVLQETNRLAEAEPLLRRALTIEENNSEPEPRKIAICNSNLAMLLQAMGRFVEAEELMRRALAIDEATLGADHPDVASDLNNLASLLRETGRLVEAESLLCRALEIDEKEFRPFHPRLAIRLGNLAQIFKATGRLAAAESLMARALAIDETSYGCSHPNIARHLNNLASLMRTMERWGEAEPAARRALSIDESTFGPHHPNIAIGLNNLAQILKATNRPVEAELLMRRVILIFELSHLLNGRPHPHSQKAIEVFRCFHNELGRTEEEIEEVLAVVAAEAQALARGE